MNNLVVRLWDAVIAESDTHGAGFKKKFSRILQSCRAARYFWKLHLNARIHCPFGQLTTSGRLSSPTPARSFTWQEFQRRSSFASVDSKESHDHERQIVKWG